MDPNGSLKQAVAMLDGVRILVENGSVFPASLHLRAMLEASLFAEWILSSNSEARANAYYVANLRRERESAEKLLAGDFEAVMSKAAKERVDLLRAEAAKMEAHRADRAAIGLLGSSMASGCGRPRPPHT